MASPSTKPAWRQYMRGILAELSPEQQSAAAAAMLAQIVAWNCPLPQPRVLLAYHPFRDELNFIPSLRYWLESKRRLVLTRVSPAGDTLSIHEVTSLSDLQPGYRGMLEPDPASCPEVSPDIIEFALVPGLAFDNRGTRLGNGKGHFDRLLSTLPNSSRHIGICHHQQVVDAAVAGLLPREPHDISMDGIWTPEGFIDIRH